MRAGAIPPLLVSMASSLRRWLLATFLVAAVATLFFVLELTDRIRKQAQVDETQRADVILVLGAAEYRGRPSPVLRARLDHALQLWKEGVAPWILTTGGSGGDPQHTEAEVSRTYLAKQGVPAESILIEPRGRSTVESVGAAVEIMRRSKLGSAVIVSDGYHIFRVKKMLEYDGIRAYGSPRKEIERPALTEWWLHFRQAAGFLLWRIGLPV